MKKGFLPSAKKLNFLVCLYIGARMRWVGGGGGGGIKMYARFLNGKTWRSTKRIRKYAYKAALKTFLFAYILNK